MNVTRLVEKKKTRKCARTYLSNFSILNKVKGKPNLTLRRSSDSYCTVANYQVFNSRQKSYSQWRKM